MSGRKCKRIKTNGEQCKKVPRVGLELCTTHGGNLPNQRRKSERIKQQMRDEKLGVSPIAADDPEARGDIALEMEIRRTVAWIRFAESEIAKLGAPIPNLSSAQQRSLGDVLGAVSLVEVTTTSGTEKGLETSLRAEKWVSGVGVWEEKLRWNRTHLANLTKQWIAAGFEAKRLQLAAWYVDTMERTQDGILRDLGLDPRDPAVRAVVRRRMEEAAKPRDLDGG